MDLYGMVNILAIEVSCVSSTDNVCLADFRVHGVLVVVLAG